MTTRTIGDPPSDEDAALAGNAGRRLARFIGQGRLTVRLPESGDEPLVLPAVAVEQIVLLLDELAGDKLDDPAVGQAATVLAADVWPAEDFSDWESSGE